MATLLGVIYILLSTLKIIVIVQFVLSILISFNVINTYNEFVRSITVALDRMTDPIYRPIRRILPDLGSLDFSPMVVLIGIQILQYVIDRNVPVGI